MHLLDLPALELVSSFIGIATALGVLFTGIASLCNLHITRKVHKQVKTYNGDTLGEMVQNTNDKVNE